MDWFFVALSLEMKYFSRLVVVLSWRSPGFISRWLSRPVFSKLGMVLNYSEFAKLSGAFRPSWPRSSLEIGRLCFVKEINPCRARSWFRASFVGLNQGRGRRLLKFSYMHHPTKSDVTSGFKWAPPARFTKRENGVSIAQDFSVFVNHQFHFSL